MIEHLRRARRHPHDAGFGMVVVMLFAAVVAVVTVTVSSIAISSLRSASRDRQALSALDSAEGGVAQAAQVMRTNPPGYFTCLEPAAGAAPAGACVTNPTGWTSATSPEKVSANGTIGSCVPNLACYAVWISTLKPYNPYPFTNSAGMPPRTVTYRVHSTGIAGGGPAAHSLIVDVQATVESFPFGVYADTVTTSGSPGIHHESVYSSGCVTNRGPDGQNGNGLSFDAYSASNPMSSYDWAYDLPEAAHSATGISTGNTCSTKNEIHSASTPCNSTYPFDQDPFGGSLSGTTCYNKWTSPVTGRTYATTSQFTSQDLYAAGYRPQGLTPSQYDALRQQAQAMGTYFTGSVSGSQISAALGAVTSSTAILYIDANGNSITFGPGDIPTRFFRAVQPAGTTNCPLNSLVIVVRNGSLTYNGTGNGSSNPNYVTASIFAPEGTYTGKGSAQILGTLFAQNISLGGTQDIYLDQCYVNNPPALLLDLHMVNYQDVDSQNIQ